MTSIDTSHPSHCALTLCWMLEFQLGRQMQLTQCSHGVRDPGNEARVQISRNFFTGIIIICSILYSLHHSCNTYQVAPFPAFFMMNSGMWETYPYMHTDLICMLSIVMLFMLQAEHKITRYLYIFAHVLYYTMLSCSRIIHRHWRQYDLHDLETIHLNVYYTSTLVHSLQ